MKNYFIYILTNGSGMFYIGITSNLQNRIIQHKKRSYKGFTAKYNLHKLIYYEVYVDVYVAIEREKQIKRWSRKKKFALI